MKLWQQPWLQILRSDGSVADIPFDTLRERGEFVAALTQDGEGPFVRYYYKPAPAAWSHQ